MVERINKRKNSTTLAVLRSTYAHSITYKLLFEGYQNIRRPEARDNYHTTKESSPEREKCTVKNRPMDSQSVQQVFLFIDLYYL